MLLLVATPLLVGQVVDVPKPWDKCVYVEGKGDSCMSGERARPFRQFLERGSWIQESNDGFDTNFPYELGRGEFKAIWRELGRLGPIRTREVRYLSGDDDAGLLLVAEKQPGLFTPLLKWSGGSFGYPNPHAALRRNGAVLEIVLDAHGNVPTWYTWAWVWSAAGPLRIDPRAAFAKALTRLLPGYGAYPAKMDWDELVMGTWVWKGEWPGKVGVRAGFQAWFDLHGSELVFKRANFEDAETGEKRHWP